MRIPTLLRCVALLPVGLVAGCVVTPAPYYATYPAYTTPSYVAVPSPPPAARVDLVGVAPYPGYIWISGFWSWGGASYVWHPGRWTAPRPGYVWSAPSWERHGGGWRERPGYWRRH